MIEPCRKMRLAIVMLLRIFSAWNNLLNYNVHVDSLNAFKSSLNTYISIKLIKTSY